MCLLQNSVVITARCYARFKVIDTANAAKWTKMLKYCDQIGHSTSKIIPQHISIVFSVCTDHSMDVLQREHNEISAETGYGR